MANTRITKARIKFISLCPRGANRLPVIYKADDETVDFDTIVKASDDLGEILAVVYAPEMRDSQRDIASAEVIKDMAHAFLADGGDVDIRHNGVAVGKARAHVAETFIVAKGDERFRDWKDSDGKTVDVTGGWATVIKVHDPALRELYRKGEWQGVSMGGTGTKQIEKSDDEGLFERLLKYLGLNRPGTQEIDMTPDQITALVKSVVAEALKPAAPVTPPVAPAAPEKRPAGFPEFTGDVSKAEDIAAYERAVAEFEIKELLKSDSAADRAKGLERAKGLSVLAKSAEDRKAAGASKAPGAPATELTGIAKEQADALAAAERMSKYAAEQRGYAQPAAAK